MSKETVLDESLLIDLWSLTDDELEFARAIERAVLQSDEIQTLREVCAVSLTACCRVNRVVDGVDFAALATSLRERLEGSKIP